MLTDLQSEFFSRASHTLPGAKCTSCDKSVLTAIEGDGRCGQCYVEERPAMAACDEHVPVEHKIGIQSLAETVDKLAGGLVVTARSVSLRAMKLADDHLKKAQERTKAGGDIDVECEIIEQLLLLAERADIIATKASV